MRGASGLGLAGRNAEECSTLLVRPLYARGLWYVGHIVVKRWGRSLLSVVRCVLQE